MPTPLRGSEAELYKDKIEVSLDGRQIFYLFFGGAVIVGLVFVLGVMVGRRVEARGHLDRAHTPAALDPLAALDRLEGRRGLSFQGALTGHDAPSEVERAIGEIEKSRANATAGDARPAVVEAAKASESSDHSEDKAESAEKKSESAEKKSESAEKKVDEDKKSEKSEKSEKTADKATSEPEKSGDRKDDGESAKAPEGAVTKPAQVSESSKARYTLQLSSFQDKREADAFLASLKASGYEPHVTQAEVSGKGTFYRVRLGSYRSLDSANDAKADFEKASKKTASVMRL